MTMANSNSFIHNIGLNKENSLTHLLDAMSPNMENEVDLVQSSKYYDDENFKIEMNSINNRLCILSLNCQSINAKYEQDAREAMRVVFFCTHKRYVYAQNEIPYEYIQILF